MNKFSQTIQNNQFMKKVISNFRKKFKIVKRTIRHRLLFIKNRSAFKLSTFDINGLRTSTLLLPLQNFVASDAASTVKSTIGMGISKWLAIPNSLNRIQNTKSYSGLN